MRPIHLGSLNEYLVIAIVLQNATVRRSVQMLRALFEGYGILVKFDGRELYGFWDAATLAGTIEQELRALKIGYRAKPLLRVSEAIVAGQVDNAATRTAAVPEQRAALLSLYGVGPASVGYILVDVFHAFDELAHISPWEQRIYSRLLLVGSADDPAPVPGTARADRPVVAVASARRALPVGRPLLATPRRANRMARATDPAVTAESSGRDQRRAAERRSCSTSGAGTALEVDVFARQWIPHRRAPPPPRASSSKPRSLGRRPAR